MLCIVLLIAATCQELCYSSLALAQLQDEIHTEDIVVSDNEALLIEDVEFRTNGSITVEDNATLIIRNARFISTPRYGLRKVVTIKDKATLIIANSNIILQGSPDSPFSEIQIENDALANVTNSEMVGWGYILAQNSSRVYIKDSTLTAKDILMRRQYGVVTGGYSINDVQNSTLDIIAVYGCSSLSVHESKITYFRSSGNSTVQIRSSVIKTIDSIYQNSTVHIWDSSMEVIVAGGFEVYIQGSTIEYYLRTGGNNNLWLIDTYVRRIQPDGATIFVGRQLPILGIITVPYTWIPYLQWMAIIIVSTAIIAIFILVRRKTRAQRLAKVARTH